jgi:hypothetical protein
VVRQGVRRVKDKIEAHGSILCAGDLAERLGTTTLLIELIETGHSNMPPMLYDKWRRWLGG